MLPVYNNPLYSLECGRILSLSAVGCGTRIGLRVKQRETTGRAGSQLPAQVPLVLVEPIPHSQPGSCKRSAGRFLPGGRSRPEAPRCLAAWDPHVGAGQGPWLGFSPPFVSGRSPVVTRELSLPGASVTRAPCPFLSSEFQGRNQVPLGNRRLDRGAGAPEDGHHGNAGPFLSSLRRSRFQAFPRGNAGSALVSCSIRTRSTGWES